MSILPSPTKVAVTQLLNAANLPTADITDRHLRWFWSYKAQDQILGVVGIEPFDRVGLLRSIAVDTAHRNRGIGTQLVQHAETMAQQMGIHELYLLTTSAQEFFENLGYVRTHRQNAPAEIRRSKEFSELCPSSSLLMKKTLR